MAKQTEMLMRRYIVGMTLLEVMFTLVIVSLLTSSAIGGWYSYQQRLKLSAASERLIDFLAGVQAEANHLNRNYRLQIRPQFGAANLQVADHDTGENLLRFVFQLRREDAVLRDRNPLAPVIFYGHRNMASSGHFILENESGRVKVIVSARGRIRRCTDAQEKPNGPIMGIALC